MVWTSSPALHITLEIPVQLQSLSVIKIATFVFSHRFFMETLYSFGDLYGLILVIIYGSVNFLRYFLCYRSDFSTVFKAFWVWKINLLISYFTNLSLKYIDYFLFYFFILVWPASALLENRANTLTRIHPAGKKKSSCLI